GNARATDEALGKLKQLAQGDEGRRQLGAEVARVLFLNDRPTDALALLAQVPEQQRTRFEILVARLDLDGAFAVVAAARKEKGPDLPALELAEARVRYGLGQKARAQEIYGQYIDQVRVGAEGVGWYADLIESLARSGQREQAYRAAARVLEVTKDVTWVPRV